MINKIALLILVFVIGGCSENSLDENGRLTHKQSDKIKEYIIAQNNKK